MKRVECHALYGMGGAIFGRGIRGLDELMDDLSPVWDCSIWNSGEWEKLADGIISRQKRYRDQPLVIFIMHSKGCLTGLQAAWRLNTAGIKVAYMAPIDPTALLWLGLPFFRMGPPMVVSKNIVAIDEFWATSGPPAAARKSDPTGKSGGRYIYPANWVGQGGKPIVVPYGHVPAASAPPVRNRIVDQVKKLIS